MKLWLYSLNTREGQEVVSDWEEVEEACRHISTAIRFGRASVEGYHLQVAPLGGTLFAKLYTAEEVPDHALTVGVGPGHARCSKLLWEALIEKPRDLYLPVRPNGSWAAYRLEMPNRYKEHQDWLRQYARSLAFAWVSMVPAASA